MNTIEICNLALSWLGGNLIISLEDDTTEAKLCKANFAHLRDAVLEAMDWTFAKKQARITPLVPTPVFRFDNQFQLPSDCLRVITAGAEEDFSDILEWEKNTNVILANCDVLYILYISRIEDSTKFSIGFSQALAQRIAAELCIPLTEDIPAAQAHWQKYERKLIEAASNDGMQGRQQRIKSGQLRNLRKYDSTSLISGY